MSSKLFGKENGRYSHGMAGTRPYSIWSTMLTRCQNPCSKSYKDYGFKNIRVCNKWQIFEGFWEDMKEGYSDDLTIDRIKNDHGYFKDNCRWATKYEQHNNRTSNVLLTLNGKTQNVTQWAKELDVNVQTFWARIRRGWSVEKTLTTPIRE